MIKSSWLSNRTVQACVQNSGSTPEFFFGGEMLSLIISVQCIQRKPTIRAMAQGVEPPYCIRSICMEEAYS